MKASDNGAPAILSRLQLIELKGETTTMMVRFYPTLVGAALAFGTPILCVLATVTFGGLCWPQRIGAVYVGASVFLQGFLAADPDRLNYTLSDGSLLREHLNQESVVMAVFGTYLPPSVIYFR